MSFWAEETLRGLAFGVAFVAAFAAAEFLRRWKRPPVELTRKAVHLLSGMGIAAFPWVFRAWQSVAVLSVLTVLALGYSRRVGALQSIHGVKRKSSGDLLYPLAVALLFYLTRGQPVLFVVPILTLAVADAAAAVFGQAFGRRAYAVEGQEKTLVGSSAFFLCAFFTVALPVGFLTPIGTPTLLLAALQIAWVAACFEAICIDGYDNLVVPICTWFILAHLMDAYPAWVLLQLGAQAGIAAALALLAWRSPLLSFAGAIALHLFLYGAFSLGGPVWLSASLVGLGVLMAGLWRQGGKGIDDQRLQVLAVFYATLAPLGALLATHFSHWQGWHWLTESKGLALFCGLLAGQLGCAISLLRSEAKGLAPRLGLALLQAALAFGLMGPLALLLEGALNGNALAAGLAVALLLPAFAFALGGPAAKRWGLRLGWLRAQAMAGLGLAVLGCFA